MAQAIEVTVLQDNQYTTATGGVIYVIPAAGYMAFPYSATVNGTAANAKVVLPPTGLNQPKRTLIVTSTVAQLFAASNA